MAKVTAKKRTARRKPDALAVAAALERAKLKRLVFALDVIAETEPETLDADSRAAVAHAAAAGR